MEPQEIVATAADFLWSSALAASIEAFTANHLSMFEGSRPQGEHRLEWTQAHKDFSQLFDLQLEQFVATQPFTQEEFVAACQQALDDAPEERTAPDSPEGFHARIVETVLMATTYEYFVQAMLDAVAVAETTRTPRGGAALAAQPPESEGTELADIQYALRLHSKESYIVLNSKHTT